MIQAYYSGVCMKSAQHSISGRQEQQALVILFKRSQNGRRDYPGAYWENKDIY
jgi:hypothetical protein